MGAVLHHPPPGLHVKTIAIAILLLSLLGSLPVPLHAQSSGLAASDSSSRWGYVPTLGDGGSRWGPLPAISDSTTARYLDRGEPSWEKILNFPWRLIAVPLGWINDGIGAGVHAFLQTSTGRWVGNLLAPKQVPYGLAISPSIGGFENIALEFTLYHNELFDPRHRARLSLKVGDLKSRKAYYGASFDERWDWGVGYRLRGQARYFGLGPETRLGDGSVYTEEIAWAGVNYRIPLGDHHDLFIRTGGSGIATRGPVRTHDSEDDPLSDNYQPATEDKYADDLPPGYGERSRGVQVGLEYQRYTAEDDRRPDRGGFQRLRLEYFEATDKVAANFLAFRAETQHFFSLWQTERTLAIRGWGAWMERVGSGEVAFQRMYYNNDPDLMRGFLDGRWRDLGMLLLNAEYRFPGWILDDPDGVGVDAYLLADLGQVYGDADEIALNNLKSSLGVGIRMLTWSGMLFRAEVAFSEDGHEFRLRGDQIFQYKRNRYLYGKQPMPVR